MELRNVKTFIKIAEIGNFSKAATELGYASVYGYPCRSRRWNGNLACRCLNEMARVRCFPPPVKSFWIMHTTCSAVKPWHWSILRKGQIPGGEVSVGIMETLCASRYGIIFREFKKRYPRANIKVVVATTLECMELLGKGKLDLILTVDKKINRINWVTAHEVPTEIRFFCPADHPFAGKKDIPLDTVLAENFIMIEEGCNYRQAFEQYVVEERGRRPSITEIGYTRLIIDAVIENLGVSLLPRFTLEEALREKKIALFSVKGFRSSMLMQVIYSKNRWVSPAMKAFIEMTKEFMPE